jgi:antitoxin component of MazEF toxin-antitoxin module
LIDFKCIGTWGGNPAVRLNGMELRKTGIAEGDKVELTYHKGKIVIKKVVE